MQSTQEKGLGLGPRKLIMIVAVIGGLYLYSGHVDNVRKRRRKWQNRTSVTYKATISTLAIPSMP